MDTLSPNRIAMSLLLSCGFVLAACAVATPAPTSTPLFSPTPDPCAPGAVAAGAAQVHRITREFDDTSFIAQNTAQARLAEVVMSLQKTRRAAEDQTVPSCLVNLKKAQLNFMNAVIITLVNFMGGAATEQVNAQLAATQQLRAVYDLELARLIGLTIVPGPSPTSLPATVPPSSSATVALSVSATLAPVTPTPISFVTAVERANLRSGPGTDFNVVATLEAGQTAKAIARSPAGDWIQIEHPAAPNGIAWVLASLVQVSVPVVQLPTASP